MFERSKLTPAQLEAIADRLAEIRDRRIRLDVAIRRMTETLGRQRQDRRGLVAEARELRATRSAAKQALRFKRRPRLEIDQRILADLPEDTHGWYMAHRAELARIARAKPRAKRWEAILEYLEEHPDELLEHQMAAAAAEEHYLAVQDVYLLRLLTQRTRVTDRQLRAAGLDPDECRATTSTRCRRQHEVEEFVARLMGMPIPEAPF